MPLALNPHIKYTVVLECDLTTVSKKRPTFVFRFLTGEEWEQVASTGDRLKAMPKKTAAKEGLDVMYEAISLGLVGWKNMIDPKTQKNIPFKSGAKQLKKVIGMADAEELLHRVMSQQKPKASDLKK